MPNENASSVPDVGLNSISDEPVWHVDSGQDADAFREVMRRVITGVSVITTIHDGKPWGMTVSAFTPVCMTPPTLLICVNENTITAADIVQHKRFGVNLLSQSQLHVSQICSRLGEHKYLDGHIVETNELPARVAIPVLQDSVATFDCHVMEMSSVGTHKVIIAAIDAILAPRLLPPLLYGQGSYLHGVALEVNQSRQPAI